MTVTVRADASTGCRAYDRGWGRPLPGFPRLHEADLVLSWIALRLSDDRSHLLRLSASIGPACRVGNEIPRQLEQSSEPSKHDAWPVAKLQAFVNVSNRPTVSVFHEAKSYPRTLTFPPNPPGTEFGHDPSGDIPEHWPK